MSPRLTKRLLNAMETAVAAMLAGCEGEGDWPDDLPRKDLDDAEDWILAQIDKRAAIAAFMRRADALVGSLTAMVAL